MSSAPTTFTQCFWHATGDLVCENVVVNTTTAPSSDYQTFSTPQPSYNPNAYLQNTDWYNKHNNSCCNVPCKECVKPPPTNRSPPHDFRNTIH